MRTAGQLYEEQLLAVSRVVKPNHRALILLLRYTGLTWPEAIALRRWCCATNGSVVDVVEVGVESRPGVAFKPHRLGGAMVFVPSPAQEALGSYLTSRSWRSGRTLVFSGPRGEPVRRGWFEERVWEPALEAVGVDVGVRLEQLALERLRESWADKARAKQVWAGEVR
jgi:hypothetical protein